MKTAVGFKRKREKERKKEGGRGRESDRRSLSHFERSDTMGLVTVHLKSISGGGHGAEGHKARIYVDGMIGKKGLSCLYRRIQIAEPHKCISIVCKCFFQNKRVCQAPMH